MGLFISNKQSTSNDFDTILITSLQLADIISYVLVEKSTSKGSIYINDN